MINAYSIIGFLLGLAAGCVMSIFLVRKVAKAYEKDLRFLREIIRNSK